MINNTTKLAKLTSFYDTTLKATPNQLVEILGEMIRKVRLERNLTQEELGKLIGVQRAQISKLENNTTNVTMETILKVFGALKAKVYFNVELLNNKIQII